MLKKFLQCLLIAIMILLPFNNVGAVYSTSTGATSVSGVVESGTTGCGGCSTPTTDTTAPAVISNLAVGSITNNSVTLSWTAPGDDGSSGTASNYYIKYYAGHTIANETDWGLATAVTGVIAPHVASTAETFVVTGLTASTHYYFAIKTADEVPNTSSISNVADATTTGVADTTVPIISGVEATAITTSQATINWTTNENADSKVVYGTVTNIYNSLTSEAAFVTTHSLNLSGLSSQTQYFYKVVSKDTSGNISTSTEFIFSTTATTDTTPPVIKSVDINSINGTSAVISWTTNESASSTVVYGTTSGNYNLTPVSSNELVSEHIISLTGLTPNTKYYFKVKSADALYNEATSVAEYNFTTADTIPPVISNVSAVPTISAVTITWNTNKSSDSQVAYGLTYQLGSIISNVNNVVNHSVGFGGLEPNTKYYYVVRSAGPATSQTSSELLNFTTLKDSTPPANVGVFNAVAGDSSVELLWTNPADADFAGVVVRSNTTGYPTNKDEGTLIYQGTGTSFKQTGLTNGVIVYYTIFTYDTSGNYSTGALKNATPYSGESKPPDVEIVVEPPTTNAGGTADYVLKNSDFILSIAGGKIQIPSGSNINTLVGKNLSISLDNQRLIKPAASAIVSFNNNQVFLSLNSNTQKWTTELTVPNQAGQYPIEVYLTYQDKTVSKTSWNLNVLLYGQVYETLDNGEKKPVSGAKVSLLTSPTLWPAESYGQTNPQITNEFGSFGYLVPPGNYILKIEKDGYHTQETGYFLSNGIVINNSIKILVTPKELKDVIDPNASLLDKAGAVAQNLGDQAGYLSSILQSQITASARTATKEVKQFVGDPLVQQTTKDVIAPTVAGAAAVGTTASIGFSQIFLYLRFLFTQPLMLFRRRKRKAWGVVYNSLTKLPLDLVIMRLIDVNTGRIVQSRVTDKDGRYAFLVEPGKYKIEINQPNFKYPSAFLSSFKEDYPFADLYHGEIIDVQEKGSSVTPNIPMDPAGETMSAKKILQKIIFRRFQHTFSVVSLLLSFVFFYISPSILTGVLCEVQIVFYFLFLRLAYPKRPKSWGIVYDEKTKQPLRDAIVRVFDEQYNKLLETQITDNKGRYSFLVGKNAYYVMSEKKGYQTKKSSTVDLRSQTEETASLGVDLGLMKADIMAGTPIAPVISAPASSEIIKPKEVVVTPVEKKDTSIEVGETESVNQPPEDKEII